jgi:hypothetical protein
MKFSKKIISLTIVCMMMLANSVFCENKAVISTVASDYSSGAISIVSTTPPRTATNNLNSSVSDVAISSYGKYFFRMIKGTVEVIQKYDINSPSEKIWDYSTLDSNNNPSNAYLLVFASNSKAYMMRFNSSKVWILDLSGNSYRPSLSDLKIGELDLSDYADSDGSCEPVTGVIVGDRLFIGMQSIDRSAGWSDYVYNNSYIAVFDIHSDTEIDLQSETDKKGLLLPIKNIGSMTYVAENNLLYVQGIGRYQSASKEALYDGGIISINPFDYEINMVIDDGDNDNHPYGNITGFAIASPQKGYFISYAGWGDNSCYIFNPMNGQVYGTVPGLDHKNISAMESGAYIDQNRFLWISNSTDARIEIIDTITDSIVDSISTGLNPQKIIFCTTGMPGNISGKVICEGHPVKNARVYITGYNVVDWTDDNGIYHLPNIPTGIHELNVVLDNFVPVVIRNIEVTTSENTDVSDVELKPMSNQQMMGDANHDGIVNLKDTIISLQVLSRH